MLLFAASGTGAMESAVANLSRPGDPVLVVSAGSFGERWDAIAKPYGLDVDLLATSGARRRAPDDVAARLAGAAPKASCFCTQSETSTGVVSDVAGARSRRDGGGRAVVVDAISCLGAVPLETDAWGIDVVVSGSQKALMTPPGLAMAARLRRGVGAARQPSRASTSTGSATRKAQAKVDAAFTPAVSLIARARRRARAAPRDGPRGGVGAPRAARPRLPRGREGDGARALLARRGPLGRRHRGARARRRRRRRAAAALRDRAGRHARRGQGAAEGQVFRIGHIGWFDSSTSRRRSRRSSSRWPSSDATIERGVAVTRALEAYERRRACDATPTRLVREPIAEAGVELLRRAFDVVVDRDSDLAETIGRLRRDRRSAPRPS